MRRKHKYIDICLIYEGNMHAKLSATHRPIWHFVDKRKRYTADHGGFKFIAYVSTIFWHI
jgi:hypothetical protein